jgi:hypothetical protein
MKIINKTMKLDNEWSEWYIIDIEIWLEDFESFDIEMPYHSKIPNIIIKDFDTWQENDLVKGFNLTEKKKIK